MPNNTENYSEQGGSRWVVGGSLDVASGGEIDIESGASLKIAGTAIAATATQLNQKAFTVTMADVSTASTVWVASPFAGDITNIQTIIDGAIATAPAVITASIGATPITGGVISITHTSSAAGTVDSVTPTAANTVAVGSPISFATSGASTNTVIGTITVTVSL